VSNPNETPTTNLPNEISTDASLSHDPGAGDTVGGRQGVAQLPTKGAVSKPPGEQLPNLSKPSGTLARSLPDWDLEPPSFLVKRGEDS
jgi:hypothetical protein